MSIIFPICLCFLPLIAGILIFTFAFHLKITRQLIACLLALAAILPISIVQFFMPALPFFRLGTVGRSLLQSLIVYGLIEELFKMVLIFPIPKKDTSLCDYLFLSLVFGLSLGCFESVVYFLDHLQKSNYNGGQLLYGMIFLRIFTSDLIHTFCAGILGIFVYKAKGKDIHFSLIVWAILLHGLYDFFAGFQNNFRLFSFAVVLFAIIECRVKYSAYKDDAE